MFTPNVETFGVTLPTQVWGSLIQLSLRADRQPSDYLRTLIEREAGSLAPAPKPPARPAGPYITPAQSTATN